MATTQQYMSSSIGVSSGLRKSESIRPPVEVVVVPYWRAVTIIPNDYLLAPSYIYVSRYGRHGSEQRAGKLPSA